MAASPNLPSRTFEFERVRFPLQVAENRAQDFVALGDDHLRVLRPFVALPRLDKGVPRDQRIRLDFIGGAFGRFFRRFKLTEFYLDAIFRLRQKLPQVAEQIIDQLFQVAVLVITLQFGLRRARFPASSRRLALST